MPFSSGTYTLPTNSFAQPVADTVISATDATSLWADFVTAFSTCLLKDGTQTVTANIPMAGFRFTGLGAGSAAGHSLRYEQLFTGTDLVIAATQANQETGTSLATCVTPARQQYHPSAAKAWVVYDSVGGILVSYNTASVTDNAAGNLSPVWTTGFSSNDYLVVATPENAHDGTAGNTYIAQILSTSNTGCNVCTVRMSDFAKTDVTYVHVAAFGDL